MGSFLGKASIGPARFNRAPPVSIFAFQLSSLEALAGEEGSL